MNIILILATIYTSVLRKHYSCGMVVEDDPKYKIYNRLKDSKNKSYVLKIFDKVQYERVKNFYTTIYDSHKYLLYDFFKKSQKNDNDTTLYFKTEKILSNTTQCDYILSLYDLLRLTLHIYNEFNILLVYSKNPIHLTRKGTKFFVVDVIEDRQKMTSSIEALIGKLFEDSIFILNNHTDLNLLNNLSSYFNTYLNTFNSGILENKDYMEIPNFLLLETTYLTIYPQKSSLLGNFLITYDTLANYININNITINETITLFNIFGTQDSSSSYFRINNGSRKILLAGLNSYYRKILRIAFRYFFNINVEIKDSHVNPDVKLYISSTSSTYIDTRYFNTLSEYFIGEYNN